MKNRIKRIFALTAAIAVILSVAIPALAGGGLSMLYERLETGRSYDLTSLSFSIPLSNYGYTGTCNLYGEDVLGDRVYIDEEQGPYNFVWEQTIPPDSSSYLGVQPQLLVGYSQIGDVSVFRKQIPIDGYMLFGFQSTPAEISVKMTFTDVRLTGRSEDLFLYDEYTAEGPSVPLIGIFSIELTTTIDGTYYIPPVAEFSAADPSSASFASDIHQYLTQMHEKLDIGSTDGITYFDEPKTITARIDLEGTLDALDAYPEMDVLGISTRLFEGQHSYSVTFDGETYQEQILETNGTDIYMYPEIFSIDCPLYVQAISWNVNPYSTLRYETIDGTGGTVPGDGGYSSSDNGYIDAYPNYQNITYRPGKVALVVAGTGIAALAASIVVNLIGDGLASAAASAVSGSVSETISGAISETASALTEPSKAMPTPAESPTIQSHAGPSTGQTPSDFSGSADAVGEGAPSMETPDLPEEDSPEVSMSLFAPAKDLLNIKGGAADITVQIEGGEGYTWNYIPVVTCPGTIKAIIPSVVGHGHLATMILGMTGAKLEARHYEVFITLIAWAAAPDGKILKTSASMEMKLHEPGIDAKRNEKGFPSVTAYVETTLKGFADIRTLSSDEYTYTTLEDGTMEIKAVNPKLGTALLKP